MLTKGSTLQCTTLVGSGSGTSAGLGAQCTYLSTQWTCSCIIVLLCVGLPVVVAVHMSTGEVYPGLTSCVKVLERCGVCVCVCVCTPKCCN